jgi:hypothetical protein
MVISNLNIKLIEDRLGFINQVFVINPSLPKRGIVSGKKHTGTLKDLKQLLRSL